ncbi:HNH endonuclease family protein [Mycobacteroides abscessus]|uniref:HNH endonuclease family protein n=1 Tax=Mycobacteroides abscessus TaxID=36809 RepID=UPI0005DF042B|nr:HNH endonuclease family protein [Mycobacteroides abscessus]CPW92602.1 putative secreted protein [Mycobacteroides abscessus]SKF41497.1 putative secreted protein [Mycobacteroides abscessus subsp. bolletii]SKH18585.1 putative secreted protein [Mycobacteroides abscessus subsp. bolletii]
MGSLKSLPGNDKLLGQLLQTLLVLAAVAVIVVLIVNGTLLGKDSRISSVLSKITGQEQSDEVAPSGSTTASGSGTPSPDPSTLTVAAPGSKNGYARARFGQPWTDDVDVEGGHNGCGTRDDILQRDLTGITLSGSCKVMSGTLADPYTGQIMSFVYGKKTSALVQIDHLVSLSNSWVSGASTWDLSELKKIANDPLNLLAVNGSSNESKGEKSADQWLPENTAFDCTYVKRQVMVKNKYRLTVTAAEKATMQQFYGAC